MSDERRNHLLDAAEELAIEKMQDSDGSLGKILRMKHAVPILYSNVRAYPHARS
ncbi:MAG: hypothetical protein ACLQBD_02520 [Syntrophobacteraceae bacterium]